MKTAIILRGLPGSGKSTVGAQLISNPFAASIHSRDDYFYVDDNYIFDPSKLGEYHALDFRRFSQKYIKAAKEHGYEVHVITVGDFDVEKCFKRCTHGVPIDAIQRMADRWEK